MSILFRAMTVAIVPNYMYVQHIFVVYEPQRVRIDGPCLITRAVDMIRLRASFAGRMAVPFYYLVSSVGWYDKVDSMNCSGNCCEQLWIYVIFEFLKF